MGVKIGVSRGSFDERSIFDRWKSESNFDILNNQDTDSLPNPDPENYSILRSETTNNYLIIELQYHDCMNDISIFN